MEEKIFGIGFQKTGTTTLHQVLETLGFTPHLHYSLAYNLGIHKLWLEDKYDELFKRIESYRSFQDSPWFYPAFFQELDKRFPKAKFILTVRDSDSWFKSYSNHFTSLAVRGNWNNWRDYHQRVYGCDFIQGQKDQRIRIFLNHNYDVIQYFKDRPAKLLVVDWSLGDGWEEVCSFLEVDPPQKQFPHANRSI